MRPPGSVTGSGRVVRLQIAVTVRAARVKGAARRQAQQRRRKPGNALEDALVVEGRQAGDQRLRVRMQRVGEDLADRADLDQPPGVHHRHPVDELRHQAHVVADQDHRGAELVLHAVERLHHLALDDHVERAGRLVGDDHLRPSRMPMAMQTRCFMPPLSSCGYMRTTPGSRSTDSARACSDLR